MAAKRVTLLSALALIALVAAPLATFTCTGCTLRDNYRLPVVLERPTPEQTALADAQEWLARLEQAPSLTREGPLWRPSEPDTVGPRVALDGAFLLGRHGMPVFFMLGSLPVFDDHYVVYQNRVMSFGEMQVRLGRAIGLNDEDSTEFGREICDHNKAFQGSFTSMLRDLQDIEPHPSIDYGLIVAGHGNTLQDGRMIAGAMVVEEEIANAVAGLGPNIPYLEIAACNPQNGEGNACDTRVMLAGIGCNPVRLVWAAYGHSVTALEMMPARTFALTAPRPLLAPVQAQWSRDFTANNPLHYFMEPDWVIMRVQIRPLIDVEATQLVCRMAGRLLSVQTLGEAVGEVLTKPTQIINGPAPWSDR